MDGLTGRKGNMRVVCLDYLQCSRLKRDTCQFSNTYRAGPGVKQEDNRTWTEKNGQTLQFLSLSLSKLDDDDSVFVCENFSSACAMARSADGWPIRSPFVRSSHHFWRHLPLALAPPLSSHSLTTMAETLNLFTSFFEFEAEISINVGRTSSLLSLSRSGRVQGERQISWKWISFIPI